ncbi:hypothetical protein [Commensalibacter oyaizuii]|uniref:Secreted protein n=1 Tax=Commensalibacter oyaizuii TaxID=3043873 RepID=A0ABT6Q3W6_9PROT|nr:hypothetical protein [Commensalibacter sp. TBRC 16381]MDI2091821.1 hypothetical protein [Commensalibacter sp. TBRC 16381]
MKKFIMVLLMMLFPLTIYASSGEDQVIQAAADELQPAFCANDLKQAIQIVERCYLQVDRDGQHRNMNQCVAADIVVAYIINHKQKEYFDVYNKDPYSAFMDSKNISDRTSKYPNFLDQIQEADDDMKVIAIYDKVSLDVTAILKQKGCFDFYNLK